MKPRLRRGGLQFVFLLSGGPGLVAQLAWVRVLSAGLGHELPAVTAVVSAYFVGLAAGAWGLDGPVRRSRNPSRWYAGLEWFSAAWILVTTPWLPEVADWVRGWLGLEPAGWREAMVGFGLALTTVGPGAAALGATLPAMERAVAPLLPDGRAVAGLYALNTVGAVAGVLAAVWGLMPALGFQGTLWVAAGIQALCGGLAWVLGRSTTATGTTVEGDPACPASAQPPAPRTSFLVPQPSLLAPRRFAPFALGLLGIGYELLGLRALAQATENTVHTFAGALAALLAGTALGAALYRWAVKRGREPHPGELFGGLGLLCVASLWPMAMGPRLLTGFESWWEGATAEAVLATAVFLGPALLMGAAFSQVVQAARGEGGSVGRAVAWNAIGAGLAGLVWVGAMLPWVGLKWSLVAVSGGYLSLIPWSTRGWRWALPVGAVALVPFLPGRLLEPELPAGARLVRHDEGRMATVTVVQTTDGHRVLRVNRRLQQGGTATAEAARRHAHLPLLLHPNPRRALFLGLGTGITMGAAVAYDGLAADGVELLPGVVAALPDFEPQNGAPQRRPGFRVFTADARRFVRTATERYDVVVADLFHPAEDGAGFLYTREHFAAMRDRLADGGLVCQWLPLHQLDLRGFRDVTRTFREVFPDATLWLLRANVDVPVVGLVGGASPLSVDTVALARRMTGGTIGPALRPLAWTDPVRVLGHCLADASSLAALAAPGEVATDDLPLVLFRASRVAYGRDEFAGRRLIEIIGGAEPGFGGWVMGGEGMVPRLEGFRRARDRHLAGLVKETEGRRREALDDYVASAGFSGDYTAGYAQAVLVAAAYAREDPGFAREVLQRLVEARPREELAREMLRRMAEQDAVRDGRPSGPRDGFRP